MPLAAELAVLQDWEIGTDLFPISEHHPRHLGVDLFQHTSKRYHVVVGVFSGLLRHGFGYPFWFGAK